MPRKKPKKKGLPKIAHQEIIERLRAGIKIRAKTWSRLPEETRMKVKKDVRENSEEYENPEY